MRCGRTKERSPGTASFKVGMILFLQRRSSVVRRPLWKSPEGLDEDLSVAEHVGELGDVFTILDRGLERFCEVLGYQDREVGVVCLVFF